MGRRVKGEGWGGLEEQMRERREMGWGKREGKGLGPVLISDPGRDFKFESFAPKQTSLILN